jgi:hypothetical protein
MSEHTPGPWIVGDGGLIHTVPNELGGRTIVVEKHVIGVPANARLIAAAPELLRALKDMREPFITAVRAGTRGLKGFRPESHSLIVQLDAVLAKAEGRS